MPVERMQHGGAVVTGAAIMGLRARVLRASIKLYLETGLRPTRGVGIAMADLDRISQDKTLDQIGDVREVNAVLGGPAADV
jgi:hypothetical protein